jgi:hypothetical protein
MREDGGKEARVEEARVKPKEELEAGTGFMIVAKDEDEARSAAVAKEEDETRHVIL